MSDRGKGWIFALLFSILSWVFFFMLGASVRADTFLDTLALARMNGKMISEEIDEHTGIGVLDTTFGDPYTELRTIGASGRMSAYRVHLRDFTCFRSKRCPVGYPSESDTRPIRAAARRLASFSTAYPNIPCYVSPALEHDVKDRATVTKWYRILHEVVPNCVPLCSAYLGWCPDKVDGITIRRERHGNNATGYFISNDGESAFDSDSVKYRTQGTHVGYWVPGFNGRFSGEKVFVPPSQRKYFSGRKDVRQLVRLARPATPRPVVPRCEAIKSSELFKTNAEYYGPEDDDGRGNKGLFIAGRNVGPHIDVETLTGERVGHLRLYGPFADGGWRYYIGNGSGQNPNQLMRDLGGEWGLLKWPGGCRVFNSIRRQGFFR